MTQQRQQMATNQLLRVWLFFKTGPTILRPTRQASKNAVLNIMERNEVVLELIKVKKNQQYIMEVIRIDSENDNIIVYQPNNGKGCLISNRPPVAPTEKGSFLQFDYKNLPQNYWKKYDLASKFVKMVRSRTPKITLHIDEAKCILYDTSPDFEAHFFQGTKFHISKEGTIKISNPDGTSLMLNSSSRSTCLSPDMQEMLEKSHKWHQYCLEEEQIREKRQEIYKDIVQFPLTIGRRNPTPSHKATTSTSSSSQSTSASRSSKQPVQREKSANQESDFDYSKLANTTTNTTNHNNTTNLSNTSTNFSTNFKLKDDQYNQTGLSNSSGNFPHELKSASTSSLNNNSVHSNHNSDSNKLNHSYQNSNHPLNSMQQQQRLRAMNNAYDSQSSSPLPTSINSNHNTSNNAYNYQDQQIDHQQQFSYNNQIPQQINRPNSSSSSSSSYNYSNPISYHNNHEYRQQSHHQSQPQQPQYIPVNQPQHIQQMKSSNRQLSSPSPTMLAQSMVPLSLLSNQTADNVPISLPQRDNFNYYNS